MNAENSNAAVERRAVRFSLALERGVGLWVRHLPKYALFGAILRLPQWWLSSMLWAETVHITADGEAVWPFWAIAISFVIAELVGVMINAAVIRGAVELRRVGSLTWWQVFSQGLRPGLGVLALGAVVAIPGVSFQVGTALADRVGDSVRIVVGLILAVPLIWLGIRWFVAIPVAVIECLPLSAALQRSAAMVKGHFKPLLGLMLFAMVVVGLAAILLRFIGMEAWVEEILHVLLFVPFPAWLASVVYFDLREQEGTTASDPARVMPRRRAAPASSA